MKNFDDPRSALYTDEASQNKHVNDSLDELTPEQADSFKEGLRNPVIVPEPKPIDLDSYGGKERLVLTVSETAKCLGLSRAHVYQAIGQGQIPSVKFGKRILVPKEALLIKLREG